MMWSDQRNRYRLYRDPRNGVLAGVCAGLAAYFGIERVAVRLAFVLALVFFFFPAALGYVVAPGDSIFTDCGTNNLCDVVSGTSFAAMYKAVRQSMEARVALELTELENRVASRGVAPEQLARHAKRPHALDYIQRLFTDFSELHGDRAYAEDKNILPAPIGKALSDGLKHHPEDGLKLLHDTVKGFASVNRVEHDAVAAADVADRRELFRLALRVTRADVAVDDVDIVGRDVDRQLPALLGVGADPTDRIDEVLAVVADVDAG